MTVSLRILCKDDAVHRQPARKSSSKQADKTPYQVQGLMLQTQKGNPKVVNVLFPVYNAVQHKSSCKGCSRSLATAASSGH